MEALIEAFAQDARALTEEQLTAYQDGWGGQLPMALLDAVYSIQAQYSTTNGKGLLPRLRKFKELHPEAATDLRDLAALSEEQIAAVVGRGVISGRTKASAVLEVARNLLALQPAVHDADSYDHANREHRRVYVKVHGLADVTHSYLGMLLGYPDVKADTWIIRAVQRVANEAGLAINVDAKLARAVVVRVHESAKLGESVTHLDHAVWLNERARPESGSGPSYTPDGV
jgi:hypothetical protein